MDRVNNMYLKNALGGGVKITGGHFLSQCQCQYQCHSQRLRTPVLERNMLDAWK